MTPDQFIAKWRAADLTERAASQSHFIDLCALLGEKPPFADDATDADYAFEKGAKKTGGGDGWADVWKRGCFGWEYKRKGRSLDDALVQLQRYALALENPPLLIVSDMDRFKVHTNWTATVSKVYEITLEDLRDGAKRDQLKWAFSTATVERLKPGVTRQSLTEQAATKFAELAKALRERGHEPHAVAHFIQRLVFCMFAEDTRLLPDRMFMRMLEAVRDGHGDFETLSAELFRSMAKGGRIGLERVAHFNGGLFEDDATLPLTRADIKLLIEVAGKDWSDVDPTIFGTLFERGLDPDKRSQLGAHYTDPDKIMRIVEPVVIRPLKAEWEAARDEIAAEMTKAALLDAKKTATAKGEATKAINRAKALYRGFLDRVRAFRILDPACGSGNFLYFSLHALLDLEHRAGIDAERLGIARELPEVGPQNVKGIEINPYAAELARVTIWIGWLQWMRRNGFTGLPEPILSVLDQIENRDAVLKPDGTAASWPAADAIVGNPPFLGDRKLTTELGDHYTTTLRAAYAGSVTGSVDLVCYWFDKAARLMALGELDRVGFVATNSISGGNNRQVLIAVCANVAIFDAWSDEEWWDQGVAVRVSMICFSRDEPDDVRLDGRLVTRINSDLTDGPTTLTDAASLFSNRAVAYNGVQKTGPFEVSADLARHWLLAPANVNARHNSEILLPYWNGMDLTRRPREKWIVDFTGLSEGEAAEFEAPFKHLAETVRPVRLASTVSNPKDRLWLQTNWWLFWRSRPELAEKRQRLARLIVTPEVSKHRVFTWVKACVGVDKNLIVVARDDDTTFGILHSRFHEAWSLRLCTWLGVGNDPRYTPTTTFETFPFPEGLTPNIPAAQYADDPRAVAIAGAARELHEKREAWLNPPDLVDRVPEVVPGYPDRLIPKSPEAAAILKKRTLTNLYNERPTWLANLHAALDVAVARAYGWPDDISTDEALDRLFALNQERSAKEKSQ
jgi:type II restriction/modification system DNA methylase subunit YeeA